MRYIDILYMSTLMVASTLSWRKRKFAPTEFFYLPYLLILHFVVEGISNYLMFHKVNNLFVYHAFIPVQYILLASIYLIHFRASGVRKYITASMVLVPICALLFVLTVQPLDANNSYANLLKNTLLLLWLLLYFKKLLNSPPQQNLLDSPLFLFSSILFINLLSNLLIDLTMNYLMSHRLILLLYQYSLAVDIIFFLVIIWIYLKRISSSPPYEV